MGDSLEAEDASAAGATEAGAMELLFNAPAPTAEQPVARRDATAADSWAFDVNGAGAGATAFAMVCGEAAAVEEEAEEALVSGGDEEDDDANENLDEIAGDSEVPQPHFIS
jgi:hypothetical protein